MGSKQQARGALFYFAPGRSTNIKAQCTQQQSLDKSRHAQIMPPPMMMVRWRRWRRWPLLTEQSVQQNLPPQNLHQPSRAERQHLALPPPHFTSPVTDSTYLALCVDVIHCIALRWCISKSLATKKITTWNFAAAVAVSSRRERDKT